MEPRAKWSTLGRRDRERQEMYILKEKNANENSHMSRRTLKEVWGFEG